MIDKKKLIEVAPYFALGTDRTHTIPVGADAIAGFVRDGVRANVPALAAHLR